MNLAPRGGRQVTARARAWVRVPYADLIAAVGVPLAVAVAAQVGGWIVGLRPVGVLEPAIFAPYGVTAYLAFTFGLLRRVARSSYRSFRPALGSEPTDADAIGESIGTPPLPASIVAIVVFEAFITGSYLSSPAARATVPAAWLDAGAIWAGWMLGVTAFALVLVLAVHQLRVVMSLHARATRIDLFRPASINAFSRLTVTMAVALVPVMAFAASAENPFVQVPVIGAMIVAAFVLPLRGMHDRLVDEKGRLLEASTVRLERVRSRIHAAIDADDVSQAKELQAALSSVLTEREVIAKLSTWPWTSTVFRGFASAVVLPVAVWLAIRLLERFV
jgi:hypothetical protein